MKIKIDKYGYLQIFRKNYWKTQECRPGGGVNPNGYENHRYYAACCDMCPLFGEPEPFSFDPITGEPFDEKIELDLCRTTLSIDVRDFEDER